ncbi:MAG: AraC family ligand binding domain-containing protein [Acidobacteriia bacterium]|nr:AraC family ligand binding domain-containing protein [Terriglobia bacterium]
MSSTTRFIHTNQLPRVRTPHGEFTEILNEELVGAKHVQGALRWLGSGEQFTPEIVDRHQLIYLMEGKGTIRLDQKEYEVTKGGGIYLGPSETATIQAAPGLTLKLFHLVVRKVPK